MNEGLVDQPVKAKSKRRANVAQMGFCSEGILTMSRIPDPLRSEIGHPRDTHRLACTGPEEGMHIPSRSRAQRQVYPTIESDARSA